MFMNLKTHQNGKPTQIKLGELNVIVRIGNKSRYLRPFKLPMITE